MIETSPGPAIGGVTLLTFCSELPMMTLPVIVLTVTRVALLRGFLVILLSMAGLTLGFSVATD